MTSASESDAGGKHDLGTPESSRRRPTDTSVPTRAVRRDCPKGGSAPTTSLVSSNPPRACPVGRCEPRLSRVHGGRLGKGAAARPACVTLEGRLSDQDG